MNTYPSIIPPPTLTLRLALGLLAAGGAATISPAVRAANGSEVTAVSSTASDGYVRATLADGTNRPETYAFGKGGYLGGSTRDDTIDKVGFLKVAHVVAFPLASQKYIPSKDPKATNLLIMVYWGATDGAGNASSSVAYQSLESSQVSSPTATSQLTEQAPPDVAMSDCYYSARRNNDAVMEKEVAADQLDNTLATAALENNERDRADERTARLLGYDTELASTVGLEGTALGLSHKDLVSEVEDSRYFVVLMAYDFQKMWQHKKPELLWVTRISVRAQGNDFGTVLPLMAESASPYFGRDSHGLLRKELPAGRIDIGVLKSLGIVQSR
jgi:hypothetical protein